MADPMSGASASMSSRFSHQSRRHIDEGPQFRLVLAPRRKVQKQARSGRKMGCKNGLERAGFEFSGRDEIGRIGEADALFGELDHGDMVVDDDASGRVERELASLALELPTI